MTEKLGKIAIVETNVRDDGSVDVTYTLDEDTKTKMAGIGVEFVLYCAAAGVDLQDALDNIIKDLKED